MIVYIYIHCHIVSHFLQVMTYRIVIWNPCDSHFDGGRFILRGQHGQKQRWQLSQSWLPDIPRPPGNHVFQQVKPLFLYLLKINLINHKHTHVYDNKYIIPARRRYDDPNPKKAYVKKNMQQLELLIYHTIYHDISYIFLSGTTWNPMWLDMKSRLWRRFCWRVIPTDWWPNWPL